MPRPCPALLPAEVARQLVGPALHALRQHGFAALQATVPRQRHGPVQIVATRSYATELFNAQIHRNSPHASADVADIATASVTAPAWKVPCREREPPAPAVTTAPVFRSPCRGMDGGLDGIRYAYTQNQPRMPTPAPGAVCGAAVAKRADLDLALPLPGQAGQVAPSGASPALDTDAFSLTDAAEELSLGMAHKVEEKHHRAQVRARAGASRRPRGRSRGRDAAVARTRRACQAGGTDQASAGRPRWPQEARHAVVP